MIADLEEIRLFDEYSNSEKLDPKVFFPKLDRLVIRLEHSLDLYRSIPKISDEQLKRGLSKAIQGISDYKYGLQQLRASVLNKDKDPEAKALDLAVENMQKANDIIKLGVQVIRERYEQSKQPIVEHKNNRQIYLYAGLIFLILSMLFFILSRKKNLKSF